MEPELPKPNGGTDLSKHPVWDVYDLLRTARFNAEYYSRKASAVRRKLQHLDIWLAITVPGSAVAAWPLWATPIGAVPWCLFAGAASIIAVAKPFLKLPEMQQAYESAVARFRAVEGDLSELRAEIAQQRKYNTSMRDRYYSANRAMRRAAEFEPIEESDEALWDKIEEEIRQEMPASIFFVPAE